MMRFGINKAFSWIRIRSAKKLKIFYFYEMNDANVSNYFEIDLFKNSKFAKAIVRMG